MLLVLPVCCMSYCVPDLQFDGFVVEGEVA